MAKEDPAFLKQIPIKFRGLSSIGKNTHYVFAIGTSALQEPPKTVWIKKGEESEGWLLHDVSELHAQLCKNGVERVIQIDKATYTKPESSTELKIAEGEFLTDSPCSPVNKNATAKKLKFKLDPDGGTLSIFEDEKQVLPHPEEKQLSKEISNLQQNLRWGSLQKGGQVDVYVDAGHPDDTEFLLRSMRATDDGRPVTEHEKQTAAEKISALVRAKQDELTKNGSVMRPLGNVHAEPTSSVARLAALISSLSNIDQNAHQMKLALSDIANRQIDCPGLFSTSGKKVYTAQELAEFKPLPDEAVFYTYSYEAKSELGYPNKKHFPHNKHFEVLRLSNGKEVIAVDGFGRELARVPLKNK